MITGGLNSIIGTLLCTNISCNYVPNPKEIVKTNGKYLSERCNNDSNIVVLNGFTNNAKAFDSRYTFYRGNVCSQVGLVISNKVDDINSFVIMDK